MTYYIEQSKERRNWTSFFYCILLNKLSHYIKEIFKKKMENVCTTNKLRNPFFFHLTTKGDNDIKSNRVLETIWLDEDAKMMMQKWKMSDIEEDEVMWIIVRDVSFMILARWSLFGSLLLLFVDFDPFFIWFFKRKPAREETEILGNKFVMKRICSKLKVC